MSEDYVTCLAQEPDGNIWIGHRSQPCESLNPDSLTLEQVGKADDQKAVYAMGMAPGNGVMTIATYGNGLVSVVDSPKVATIPSDDSTHTDGPVTIGDAAASVDQLPVDANVPESELIEAQLKTLLAVPPSPGEYQPFVAPLPDDWVTAGDWLGRYGTYCTVLSATSSPHDFLWGAAPTKVRYSAKIGPNHVGKDSLRYWVEWLYTAKPSVLELPTTYLRSRILRGYTTANVSRRESEWDDHGEAYDRTLDGPNVYVTVALPAGLFRLSTYHLYKDAHDSLFNVTRDYRISIREHPNQEPLHDISTFESMPELAHARIVNFWGGVWKRFVVRGPVDLTIEFNRNYSSNTTVSAVTLDLLDGDPPPYYQTFAQYGARLASRYNKWSVDARKSASVSNLTSIDSAQAHSATADGLMIELDRLKYENTGWWAANGDAYYPELVHWYCAPSYSASPKYEVRLKARTALAKCYFETGLYNKSERCLTSIGQRTARAIEQALPWDGISGTGDGYKVVISYMRSTDNLPKALKTKSLH